MVLAMASSPRFRTEKEIREELERLIRLGSPGTSDEEVMSEEMSDIDSENEVLSNDDNEPDFYEDLPEDDTNIMFSDLYMPEDLPTSVSDDKESRRNFFSRQRWRDFMD
jgi:cell division protein FtsI/penicillin-binding protein 2